MIKINAFFSLVDDKSNLRLAIICNGIEVFFFLTAVWIFALKYHQTATEVSIMLGSEIESLCLYDSSESGISDVQSRANKRRRKYCLINTVNIILLVIFQLLYILSFEVYSKHLTWSSKLWGI